MDLTNGKWVPIFLNAVGEDVIRRDGYLVTLAANGDIACKACGKYIRNLGNLSKHREGHIAELDAYLEVHTLDGKVREKPRKPQPKPKPLAALAREYTPEEQAILDEFGL